MPCQRTINLTLLLFLFCPARCLLASPPLKALQAQNPSAASGKSLLLRINPATGMASLYEIQGNDTNQLATNIRSSETRRVPYGKPITVMVGITNTSFYDHRVVTDTVPVPEVSALRSFGATLKPYLLELANIVSPYTLSIGGLCQYQGPDPDSLRAQAESTLMGINRQLTGARHGLEPVRSKSVAAIDSMRATPNRVPQIANALNVAVTPAFTVGPERRLVAIDSLIPLYALLRSQVEALTGTLLLPDSCGVKKDLIQAVMLTARQAFDDQDGTLLGGYEIERVTLRLIRADTVFTNTNAGRVRFTRGVRITVSRTRDRNAFVAAVARGPEFVFQISLLPDWPIRPALAVSFLVSPKSRFEKYSAKDTIVSDTTRKYVVVKDTGLTNDRFAYGVSLGFIPRWLDWREHNNLAVIPLELTINPADKVRSIALGPAVTWSVFKVGGGLLWTKKVALPTGAHSGSVVLKDEFRTVETYNPGRFYLSFTLVGWPPFAP